MNKRIDTSILKAWKGNLQATANTPVLTTHALITLAELESFVQQIKAKQADSVRINLVRFDWKNNEPQSKKETGTDFPLGCRWQVTGNKTQVAIALNGARNFTTNQDYTTQADDIIENGEVLMLIPGGEAEGPTGHNPKPTGT
jgi:cytochrome oxidase Cu insertion factor (SCO1/SenC/PrrC family)